MVSHFQVITIVLDSGFGESLSVTVPHLQRRTLGSASHGHRGSLSAELGPQPISSGFIERLTPMLLPGVPLGAGLEAPEYCPVIFPKGGSWYPPRRVLQSYKCGKIWVSGSRLLIGFGRNFTKLKEERVP